MPPIARPAPLGSPAVGWLAAGASALRGRRIFHPDGVAFAASFVRERGGDLRSVRSGPAIVRYSRGVGFPQPLPDVLGLAIKLPDHHGPGRDQDFLLVSSIDAPWLRWTIVPARSFLDAYYSTVLPYRLDGGLALLGASCAVRRRARGATDVDELRATASAGDLVYAVSVVASTGLRRRIGHLEIGTELPAPEAEALRFNPWNSHPDVVPAGWVNALRASAYAGSQRGRRAARSAAPTAHPLRRRA